MDGALPVSAFLDPQVDQGRLVFAFAGCFAGGVSTGAVGLRGPLMAPLLMAAGVPPLTAVTTQYAAGAVAAVFGALTFWWRRLLDWRNVAVLCAGCAPAAGLATPILPLMPPMLIKVIVASVAIAAGAITFRRSLAALRRHRATHDLSSAAPLLFEEAEEDAECGPAEGGKREGPSRAGPSRAIRGAREYHLLALGALVGVGSVLSATGGPLLLMPLLLFFFPELDISASVGLSLSLSFVFCVTSTVVSTWHTGVDGLLVTAVSACLVAGIPLGAMAAAFVDSNKLTLIVSCCLMALGISTSLSLA